MLSPPFGAQRTMLLASSPRGLAHQVMARRHTRSSLGAPRGLCFARSKLIYLEPPRQLQALPQMPIRLLLLLPHSQRLAKLTQIQHRANGHPLLRGVVWVPGFLVEAKAHSLPTPQVADTGPTATGDSSERSHFGVGPAGRECGRGPSGARAAQAWFLIRGAPFQSAQQTSFHNAHIEPSTLPPELRLEAQLRELERALREFRTLPLEERRRGVRALSARRPPDKNPSRITETMRFF